MKNRYNGLAFVKTTREKAEGKCYMKRKIDVQKDLSHISGTCRRCPEVENKTKQKNKTKTHKKNKKNTFLS